ncbi:membrane protein [Enterobacterales bacterium]|nr:membrane protein [Enterobacterales bacterium]
MAKFALVELLIIALAVVVWWRWYDGVSRAAMLALGLSFGGLFALYGQIYQTGADSWELFRAWTLVLLPLALIGRQNALWFCTWVIANLAFQLYYASRAVSLFDDVMLTHFSWLADTTLYAYFAIQGVLLILREFLAERATKKNPYSWLAHRWLSRVMAAYLLMTITPAAAEAVSYWGSEYGSKISLLIWAVTLLAGYFYYHFRRPDLCVLTLGVISVMLVGCTVIVQLFDRSWDVGTLFAAGCLMALWLAGGGAVLLHWRRKLYPRQAADIMPSEVDDLLNELRAHQLLNDEQISDIQQRDHSDDLPWYLRAVLAAGGWAAALIILLLLALILYATDLLDTLTGTTLIIPSLLIAVLAAVLLRAKGVGKQHIGLAWAIAATCGLCLGVYLLIDPRWDESFILRSLWFLPVLALMGLSMPNRMYRFMSVTAFILVLVLSSGYSGSLYLSPRLAVGLLSLVVACIMVLWLWIISRQESLNREIVACLMHGIPAALMLLCLASVHSDFVDDLLWDDSVTAYLPVVMGFGIAAGLFLTGAVQAGAFRSPATAIYLPAAIICAAVAIFSPGISFGLALLLVSRYLGSKGWLVTSGCFLMLYLTDWYYFLHVTLLQKSLLLLVTGVVLLGLALVAKKRLPEGTGVSYAN